MKKSIRRNVIYNIIKSCSVIFFPLITFPYISRILQAENLGKINFGNSIISYFSLIATLGVTNYAVRECARIKDDKEEFEKTVSQIFSINILATIIAYVLLAVTLIFWDKMENYRGLIVVQSISILFITLGADWINTTMEDFGYITVRTMVFQLLSICAMFIFVRTSDDFMKYTIITMFAVSGANVLNIFYRRRYGKIRFTFNMKLKRHLPSIIMMFAMTLSQVIYCNSDLTIIGIFRGDYEVGLYSASVKIYNIVNAVVSSIAIVMLPALSLNIKNCNWSEVNRLLRYELNTILTLGIPIIVGINILASEIITIIAGKNYLEATTSLHILTIALFFSYMGGFIGGSILMPTMQERICLIASIVGATVNVIGNFVLIPKFGINAAASTTALAECLSFAIVTMKIDKKIFIDNKKGLIAKPCIGCVGILVIWFVFSGLIETMVIRTVLTIICSVIVYALIQLVLKNELAVNLVRHMKKMS